MPSLSRISVTSAASGSRPSTRSMRCLASGIGARCRQVLRGRTLADRPGRPPVIATSKAVARSIARCCRPGSTPRSNRCAESVCMAYFLARPAITSGEKIGAFQKNIRGSLTHAGMDTAHDAGNRQRLFTVSDDQRAGIQGHRPFIQQGQLFALAAHNARIPRRPVAPGRRHAWAGPVPAGHNWSRPPRGSIAAQTAAAQTLLHPQWESMPSVDTADVRDPGSADRPPAPVLQSAKVSVMSGGTGVDVNRRYRCCA